MNSKEQTTEKRIIKNPSPSIVIMTGDGLRHHYFANQLIKEFYVKGIVSEEKKPMPQAEKRPEDLIIREHFKRREQAEMHYLGNSKCFQLPEHRILSISNGESNSTEVFNWVKNLNPDFLILYGSSIIKDPLLSFFDKRIINIHLGLSPYYRGSGTNFWPLVNKEPECVGATIHLAILRVDAGPILGQVRPDIKISDKCHDLGCKSIIKGQEAMIKCINLYHQGLIEPQSQFSGGRIYRRDDFNADAIKKMWHNFEQAMIEKYLADREQRNREKPIIEI